jgi:hypothetical protein
MIHRFSLDAFVTLNTITRLYPIGEMVQCLFRMGERGESAPCLLTGQGADAPRSPALICMFWRGGNRSGGNVSPGRTRPVYPPSGSSPEGC